jgi:hypothetical protein
MEVNIYNRAKLKHAIWISIALFFVIFYSCPVKKYIQLQLGQLPEASPISTVITQSVSSVNKICIINRGISLQKIIPPFVKHTNLDPVVLFLLSSLLAFLGLLYLDDLFSIKKKLQQAHRYGLVPLYLQIHKLQV